MTPSEIRIGKTYRGKWNNSKPRLVFDDTASGKVVCVEYLKAGKEVRSWMLKSAFAAWAKEEVDETK